MTPTLVVTIHTPVGDVPIAADASGGGGTGQVTILGISMPYDVSLQMGAPDTSAPGTVWSNLQMTGPVVAAAVLAVGAYLHSRRRR